jgi:hypothetical protein
MHIAEENDKLLKRLQQKTSEYKVESWIKEDVER